MFSKDENLERIINSSAGYLIQFLENNKGFSFVVELIE